MSTTQTQYGVVESGFVLKRFPEIHLDLVLALKNSPLFGNNFNVEPDSAMGQLLQIFAEREARLWEMAQAIYYAAYPNTASGAALDNLCALTGIKRKAPSYSRVAVTFSNGVEGVTIPFTTTVSVAKTAERFVVDTDSYETEPVFPEDGSQTVIMIAENSGPIEAPVGSIVNLCTSIAGAPDVTVINNEKADLGDYAETDSDLRLRRQLSLQMGGYGTVESIRSRLSDEFDGITELLVFENHKDYETNNRPPHSLEVIVRGSYTDAELAQKIWEVKPAGIETCSTAGESECHVCQVITDSMGLSHDIHFTKAEYYPVWLQAELKVNRRFNLGLKQKFQLNPIEVDEYSAYVCGYYLSADTFSEFLEMLNRYFYFLDIVAVPDTPNYTLEHRYAGCPFSILPVSGMTYTLVRPADGDQLDLIGNIVTLAEEIQTIGKPAVAYKYFEAVNRMDGVEYADIHLITADERTGELIYPDSQTMKAYQVAEFAASRVLVIIQEVLE